jgi:hydroxypyruvate isomerase
LLLEPLNAADRKSPLLHSVDRALGVIAELGNPSRLLLLFDAYHLFQEEDDVISALSRSAHRIGHVQVADYPGRAEPGSGEVPIARLLAELAQTSYSGWLGLEYFPSGREPSPFSWLLDYEGLDDRLLRGLAS